MKRLVILTFFITLFIAFLVIWNQSYQQSFDEAYVPLKEKEPTPEIPSEWGVFRRSEYALDYSAMPIDKQHQRSLSTYYNNRAFYGAPPTIPHAVNAGDRSMGADNCLKCHENGGFVAQFNAYTPITPHPEMINCRQCHVPQKTQSLFKGTNFKKNKAPGIGNNALITSPPIVPHSIQMRENCLSCHAGPGAPKEIRVSHPERVNCRQCHVLNDKKTHDIGNFKRPDYE